MSRNRKNNKEKKAFGLIDRIINKMPEIHIPGYQYCGPGTKLAERLARGDPGINKLDVACKEHDFAYASCKDTKSRRKADKELIGRAFKRVYSGDAKLDERAAALLVSGLMGAKMGLTKIGLGLNAPKKKINKKNTIPFSRLIRSAKGSIKKSLLKPTTPDKTIIAAIRSAQKMKRGKTVKTPRVLKIPKFGGGFLKILPIISSLSAIGCITPTAAGVVEAIREIQNAKKQNMSSGKKIGRGLNLIYRSDKTVGGSGFYLKPYNHQQQQQS